MTFAIGRRFVIADGVERWKDADAEQVAAALAGVDPESLTVAFFAREEGRYKVPAGLVKAVEAAGGPIAEESQVKPRELPRWLSARAKELGLELDNQGARALIAQVGDRQQRLQRELEKLALEHGAGASIGVEEVAGVLRGLVRAQAVDARRRARRGRPQGRHARADRAPPAGRAPARPALRHGPPPARRARDRRGAGRRPAARADQEGPADARLRRRPPDRGRGRRDVECLPAGARADGRPRGAEPRPRRRRGGREHRRRCGRSSPPRAEQSAASEGSARRRGGRGPRGTSCARRCSCAARRA